MATRRIQDLENVEEVLADSIIPVGEATKTKSMLVSQLKNWLSSFFVGKTGNETITGAKTFMSPMRVSGNNTVIYVKNTEIQQGVKPSANLAAYPFYVMDKNEKTLCYASFLQRIDGDFSLGLYLLDKSGSSSSALRIGYDKSGNLYTFAPTPAVSDNSTNIVTTAWVHSNLKNILIPNVGSLVNIVSAVSTRAGYTAPSSGFVSVQTNVNGATTTLSVGGKVVAQAQQYSGDSHGGETKQLFALVGKGQVVKTSQAVGFGVFVPFK